MSDFARELANTLCEGGTIAQTEACIIANELERLAGENAAMKAHMEALRQQTCPCYLYTDPDCPYLALAGPHE